jgi:hypothetical protein
VDLLVLRIGLQGTPQISDRRIEIGFIRFHDPVVKELLGFLGLRRLAIEL